LTRKLHRGAIAKLQAPLDRRFCVRCETLQASPGHHTRIMCEAFKTHGRYPLQIEDCPPQLPE